MAVQMILDVDSVSGESTVKGFEGKIDIFSYSGGASNPTSVGTGSGSGAGKVSWSSFSVQKTVDTATVPLMLACCNGNHFSTAKLTVQEAGGASPVQYLVIDFTQVFVDSISWGGASGGDKPSESVSFSYATIKYTYMKQDATGKGVAAGDGGWNLQTGANM